MSKYFKSFVLLFFFYPLLTAYTCPTISPFYIDYLNLSTLNQSINFCSQYEMTLLNLTNSTITSSITQTLQLINCTNNFWYSYENQTGLVSNIGSSTDGLVCSVVPILGLYCIETSIEQAMTICTRKDPIEIQQKCSTDESNQHSDLQQFLFTQKTIYASILNVFRSRNQVQCNNICSKINTCIGTNYKDWNCTLYM